MRRVLRQDPDVILIGEMRDEETVRTALSAAETGHLVLSTLHTLDASETINRIIDFFPPHLQQQARVMLASTLRGAVSQRLVPRADGDGRVAVCEVMVVTGRVQDLILNPQETGRITEVISEGSYYGMQTFDQALLDHVVAGQITEEIAFEVASSAHDFKLMLAAQGQRASGIEQVIGGDDDPEEATSVRKALSYTRLRRPGRPRIAPPARGPKLMTENPCPVGCCAEIISGKWTLLVIRDLAGGSQRFCELERSLDGISPRTLSLRLRALEDQGIVERRTYPEVPPRVEYGLPRRAGPRAADRGHARVRAPLALGERAPARARRRRSLTPGLQLRLQRRNAGRSREACRHARPGCSRGPQGRWPPTPPSACASWSPPAARSPTTSRSPAAARRLPQYMPLTARFVRDNAPALHELDSFGSGCAAIESAGLAGPYLERIGIAVPAGPAQARRARRRRLPVPAVGRVHRLLARRRSA